MIFQNCARPQNPKPETRNPKPETLTLTLTLTLTPNPLWAGHSSQPLVGWEALETTTRRVADGAYVYTWMRTASVPNLGSGAAHTAENGSMKVYENALFFLNENSILK